MANIGNEDSDLGFQIAPMVDVVFVLMLFFMASASSGVKEREIAMTLLSRQKASSEVVQAAITPIFVDISAEGQITINDKVMGDPSDKKLEKLVAFFKTYIEQFDGQDPVILRPANETRQDRVIAVLNAATRAGVKNLSFN